MEINELISQYGELNRIYQDVVKTQFLSFENQCFIVDFKNKYIDIQSFESMLLNNFESKKSSILFQSIWIEIEKNLNQYEQNKSILENLSVQEFYLKKIRFYDSEISIKERSLASLKKKYYEANDILEGTCSPFKEYSDLDIKIITDNYYNYKNRYEAALDPINKLYTLKNEWLEFASPYINNDFSNIYNLSCLLLATLDKYFNLNELPTIDSTYELIESKRFFFNSGIINSIYRICDDNIFEKSSEGNYFLFFNMEENSIVLKKKGRNKNYICYIVHFLSGFIDKESMESWLNKILLQLDLDKINVYDKRHNDVETQCKSGNKKAINFHNSLMSIKEHEHQLNSQKK